MIKETCHQNYYTYTKDHLKENLKSLSFNKIEFWTQDKISKKANGKIRTLETGRGAYLCVFC